MATRTTGMPISGAEGVGATEDCRVIEETLVPEGNRLFGEAQFVVVEDGAYPRCNQINVAETSP